jgi:hypothetical protein
LSSGKDLGSADTLGQQDAERNQEQQPAYAGGDGPVAISGVAAEGEGEDGTPAAAADRASATACDAGMMPRITT